jgi:hypothetical protein
VSRFDDRAALERDAIRYERVVPPLATTSAHVAVIRDAAITEHDIANPDFVSIVNQAARAGVSSASSVSRTLRVNDSSVNGF